MVDNGHVKVSEGWTSAGQEMIVVTVKNAHKHFRTLHLSPKVRLDSVSKKGIGGMVYSLEKYGSLLSLSQ